jgi:2-keto-4-pentenoate hydratase/2-oxohepta-3-ene-1,7-dioic acid hydratase in catechol pathway
LKIIAIGRNYTEHARELNNPIPTSPVIFLKPDTALLKNQSPFYIPEFSNSIEYEVEIVVKISKEGKHIQPSLAKNYYDEISLGIDFTARDIQKTLKEKGLPWELAKGFDHSAPIGEFVNKSHFENIQNIPFGLKKNGEWVQKGNSSEMIFTIDALISYVSARITLKKGDLIMTGTPAGVGPVQIGDLLEAYLDKDLVLSTPIK